MQYTRTFIHLLTILARIKLKLDKVVRFRKVVVLRFVQRAIKDHWLHFSRQYLLEVQNKWSGFIERRGDIKPRGKPVTGFVSSSILFANNPHLESIFLSSRWKVECKKHPRTAV